MAVDASPAMLDAARERLRGVVNVELRRGELESLPLEDASVDLATLILVLHHSPDPERALSEAARVLRPGGKLLLVDMVPHDRHEYREEMGHVWLGFSEEQLVRLLESAALRRQRILPLPVEPGAEGPGLFALTAVRDAPQTVAGRRS
jgi:ArsR family transcriptional regulator